MRLPLSNSQTIAELRKLLQDLRKQFEDLKARLEEAMKQKVT